MSEPNQPDQSNVSLNQSFSIPDVPPILAADVHDFADAQKVNYAIPDIERSFEELRKPLQLMQSRHKENINVDTQSSTFQFKKQPSPPIRIDLVDVGGVVEDDVSVSVNEGGHQVIDDTGGVADDVVGVSINESGQQVIVNANVCI
ncbi:hypothetical protein H5410_039305 [Solanum commersonii]|uniref:Uncharacterized protein n=1 Tax=Solanum commersonii TaxID=4109 RepID=A0A9J5YCP5_SOLCO|nr:hypothetical protein H5410_039305 [Solanum commersonii]